MKSACPALKLHTRLFQLSGKNRKKPQFCAIVMFFFIYKIQGHFSRCGGLDFSDGHEYSAVHTECIMPVSVIYKYVCVCVNADGSTETSQACRPKKCSGVEAFTAAFWLVPVRRMSETSPCPSGSNTKTQETPLVTLQIPQVRRILDLLTAFALLHPQNPEAEHKEKTKC